MINFTQQLFLILKQIIFVSMEQIENSLANLTIKDCDKVTEFLEKCNFESKYSVRVIDLE